MTLTNPAPLDLDEVLSPAWLDAALGAELPGRVVGVEMVEKLQTVATKVRFAVTCETPTGETAQRGYCVKGYFGAEPGRRGGGQSEGSFYRTLAPTLPVRVPRCAYIGVDPETSHAMILMDDLVVAGCRFLTALTPYSPEEAAASLRQLALLHATTWNQQDLTAHDWLRPRFASIADGFPLDLLQGLLDDGRADGLPATLRDAARVTAAWRALGERGGSGKRCLVHGDAHAGNLYVDPQGQPGVVDWQVAHFGDWATDVAYHVAAVLTIEDRRAHEQELLRGYLDELTRLGADAPDWEAAWADYRAHLAYGYYFWAITRMVDRPIILEFIPRLGAAVDDHGTFELLGV